MTGRFFYLVIIIFIGRVLLYAAGDAVNYGLIKINGSTGVVDITDILDISRDRLKESDIKRICAGITERYHQKGYSAFYIREAVLNRDGSAELFFNESPVESVIINGVSRRKDDAAVSLFKKGVIFNEFVLRENINEVKRKYNLKKLNVTVKRGELGQVILAAEAEERVNEIEAAVSSSPIYALMPELTYRINFAGLLAGASAASSFNQEDRSCSSGSVFLNSENLSAGSYFTIIADVSDKKDSFCNGDNGASGNNGSIYRHRSLASKAGYCYIDGAAGISLLLDGKYDQLKDYPGPDRGISFSGIQMKLKFNNSGYKIDYKDVTAAEIVVSPGWNFIENRQTLKLTADCNFNLPLFNGFFVSLAGNCFYTSDEERFSHTYVFDRIFPCRADDYSSTSWRCVSGLDLSYEVLKRRFYISPEFKWGLYNKRYDLFAAGLKFLYNTGKVKVEASYLADVKRNIKDGVIMFSAGAVYL